MIGRSQAADGVPAAPPESGAQEVLRLLRELHTEWWQMVCSDELARAKSGLSVVRRAVGLLAECAVAGIGLLVALGLLAVGLREHDITPVGAGVSVFAGALMLSRWGIQRRRPTEGSTEHGGHLGSRAYRWLYGGSERATTLKAELHRALGRLARNPDDERAAALCSAIVRALGAVADERSVCYNVKLSVALLRTLRLVGDGTALPVVRRLAEKAPRRVRTAALDALPSIEDRAARAAASGTLLRPAERVYQEADQLLRPAQGAVEEDSSRLLRPAQHDQS